MNISMFTFHPFMWRGVIYGMKGILRVGLEVATNERGKQMDGRTDGWRRLFSRLRNLVVVDSEIAQAQACSGSRTPTPKPRHIATDCVCTVRLP